MSFERFAVVASRSPNAQKALEEIKSRYKLRDPEDAEVIVALGGDGFMLSPIYSPGAIEEFVDLVVPELQQRGLFRKRYKGWTQRDHLSQFD